VNGSPNIGLSHVIPEGASIVHSTVLGRKTFGRISDLLCAWAIEEHRLGGSEAGSLRILASALLESLPENQNSPTRIEMAIFNDQVLIAVRMEWGLEVDTGGAEKEFTKHWLNSTQMQVLRRSVDPKDQIEVRYHQKSGLVEWRIVRSLASRELDPTLSSFLVFEDSRENLVESGSAYRDLGDLPFESWLEDAYKFGREKSASGEIRIKGEALQGDLEYTRLKVSSEIDEIEKRILKSGESNEEREIGEGDEPSGLRLIDDLIKKIQKKEMLEEELESSIEQLRREARDRKKEISDWKKKYQQMIELLNRKEMALYTQANEMRAMQKSHGVGSTGSTGSRSETLVPASDGDQATLRLFREKAIQMYEKLRAVSEQNEILKKEILIARERVGGGVEYEGSTTIRSSTEDLEKKLDRVQRALEAEKAKTSALLERALSAEKESQGSAHLITDLEAKVEHTLKSSMQYKKEIDSMKQKLVQADAEKNKVKNELLKAQAQIQTLMKRQAA
jgi:hypothetical protein